MPIEIHFSFFMKRDSRQNYQYNHMPKAPVHFCLSIVRPSLTSHIFDFSETTERYLKKLDS